MRRQFLWSLMAVAGWLLNGMAACADDEKTRQPQPIVGTWRISQAATLTGGAYTGEVTIREARGVYNVQWRTNAGNYPGVGLRKGDDLFVGWGDEAAGIVVYTIGENGVLEGEWTQVALEGIGTERATPVGNINDLAGRYTLAGGNPNGGQYIGTLAIRKTGDVYQLQWGGNAGNVTGVGMRVGNHLVVGYGAPVGSNGIVHYHFNNNAATGRWTLEGNEGLAVEDLVKR